MDYIYSKDLDPHHKERTSNCIISMCNLIKINNIHQGRRVDN